MKDRLGIRIVWWIRSGYTGFKGGGARLISEQKIFRFRNKKRVKFF